MKVRKLRKPKRFLSFLSFLSFSRFFFHFLLSIKFRSPPSPLTTPLLKLRLGLATSLTPKALFPSSCDCDFHPPRSPPFFQSFAYALQLHSRRRRSFRHPGNGNGNGKYYFPFPFRREAKARNIGRSKCPSKQILQAFLSLCRCTNRKRCLYCVLSIWIPKWFQNRCVLKQNSVICVCLV